MPNRAKPNHTRKIPARRKTAMPSRRHSSGAAMESTRGNSDELLATLVRSETQALELLRRLLSERSADAFRPGLLRCLRLHESTLLQLESLRDEEPDVVEATPLGGMAIAQVPREVILVTDEDIIAE